MDIKLSIESPAIVSYTSLSVAYNSVQAACGLVVSGGD